ncbi:hypothetical protein GIJ78_06380 [Escherichia coli]|nr:hypothetical protein [Pseudomonas sp. Marseille-Q3773]MRF40154.1 hypothetical protein [Escherichia coli]
MVTSDAISILRTQVDAAKQNGLSEVSLDSLCKLIDLIEQEDQTTPTGVEHAQAALEKFKSDLSDWQASNQRDHESNLEMLRATIGTSHLAIKSALLINGGAAVAFLAFLGNAWSRFPGLAAKSLLACSLGYFTWGVLCTGIGACVAYVCQAAMSGEFGEFSQKIGEALRWVAVILVVGSFVLFYFGCSTAIKAFEVAG